MDVKTSEGANARELIEPLARDPEQDRKAGEWEREHGWPQKPNLEEAAISAAISLKRIADALWGIEGTSGLLELLNPLQVRNNY